MVAICAQAYVSRASIRAHAKLEKANALFVSTPKPTKIDSVRTDLSRRLIRRRSTKKTKVVVGDSLGRDNVEPIAPASGTSLQGSSNRSVLGSGCTPRGGSKVAPRAPAMDASLHGSVIPSTSESNRIPRGRPKVEPAVLETRPNHQESGNAEPSTSESRRIPRGRSKVKPAVLETRPNHQESDNAEPSTLESRCILRCRPKVELTVLETRPNRQE